METSLPISYLNDFIFCPKSIYFHQLYGKVNTNLYQTTDQISGTGSHQSIENKTYSTSTLIFQGIEIYSEKYNLHGKIDIFDASQKKLRERKKEIKTIYDGYVFQLYAQFFSLQEMGYEVQSLEFYDITHNKTYPVKMPQDDIVMHNKFEKTVQSLHDFSLNFNFVQDNAQKCERCIYSNLCDSSLC